ncbi:MAG: response regulator [Actinomycetota bacterium]
MKDGAVGTCQVMVVDDDSACRETYGSLLTMAGHAVVSACDGQDALDKLETAAQLPCVILLDLRMPRLDGYGFRAAQRRHPRLGGVPVVVMSAERPTEAQLSELDPQAYLNKPCGLRDILGAVQAVCDCGTCAAQLPCSQGARSAAARSV